MSDKVRQFCIREKCELNVTISDLRAKLEAAKKTITGLAQTIDSQQQTNLALVNKLQTAERVNKLHGEMLDEYQKVLIPNYSMTSDRFKKEADNLRGQLKTELKNKEYLQGWCDYLVKRLQAVFDTISEYPSQKRTVEGVVVQDMIGIDRVAVDSLKKVIYDRECD